jgi:hypothetical protein
VKPLAATWRRRERQHAGARAKQFVRSAALLLALALLAAAQARLPAMPGWRLASPSRHSRQPPTPPAEAAILSEFGLQAVRPYVATPTHRAHATIPLLAYRFVDSYGAYGAFTYLRQPEFRPLALAPGVLAAGGHGRILIMAGTWVVALSGAAPPSAVLLAARQLAHALAPAGGAPLVLPTVAYQLPRAGFQPGSRHYAEGPLAFAAACSWVPPALVGFNRSAEAVVGRYAHGIAMAVVSYPTPQIATAHFAPLAALAGVRARRSGSLIALVHGADAAAAAPLLHAVRYQADLTMVPPAPVGIQALPSLILSIFVFCGLIFAVAVVVGILAGGVRVVLNRALPQRFPRLAQDNLIQLHLGQGPTARILNNRK